MVPITPITPLEDGVEMFQRGKFEPLFPVPSIDKPRPLSEITEMYHTDFEDDEDNGSEFEEFAADYEFQSNEGRRSQTTISTLEEVSTPHSSRRSHFNIQLESTKPVEGPRGPHLFRSSQTSSIDFNFEYALQLSPLSPKDPERTNTAFSSDRTITTITGLTPLPRTAPEPTPRSSPSELDLDWDDIHMWTTQQVSLWMSKSCFDFNIIEQFEANDINGAVLMDMQFEDLKELGIQSFGKRHTLWNQICALRGGEARVSPVATPFQDIDGPCDLPRSNSIPSRLKSQDSCGELNSGKDDCVTPGGTKKRRGRKHRRRHNGDPITPAESVSIVAIEQLLPKPHKCAKGEQCPKWRKQQRHIKRLQEDHDFPISPDKGGQIYISGDPGNALTAPNIVVNVHRPTSEAIPSVVASSDLLGPSQTPEFALQEDLVQKVQERDPQDNVRNFLALQHMEPPAMVSQTPIEGPPSPTFEMFPPHPTGMQPLPQMLHTLPKLSIPRSSSAQPSMATPNTFQPAVDMSTIDAIYSAHFGSMSPNRHGTPCSEMDIPMSSFPLGPVARETTQSVPPDMHFRSPITRTSSRADWRRPSFALPCVNEHEVFPPTQSQNPLSAIHPQTGVSIDSNGDHKITPITLDGEESSPYPGASHAGWMKKRKTKLLRHEWHDQHFRLQGTALSMHPTSSPTSRPLDTLNIDEYAVACSSLASNNKLAAKLKALRIASGAGKKEGTDGAAFSFQLVPAGKDGEKQDVVRRAVAGGKTHHFAVKSRDERIDWMRELMLAKALQAKRDGYEVEVNGNAV